MKKFLRFMSYVLVGTGASLLTLLLVRAFPITGFSNWNKLAEIENKIDAYFIEDVDLNKIEDAAANAMIEAMGDRWSYYLTKSEYENHIIESNNAYVGVGITIQPLEDGTGFEILSVVEGGPAQAAGVLPGDILTKVQGQSCAELGLNGSRELIQGKEGEEVSLTVLRNDVELVFPVILFEIKTDVAIAEMLDSGYALIRIRNFESRCSEETIEAVESMIEQGAKGLIFDVRFNPGGYKDELVKLLDYLLPEGPLFQSLDYRGIENVDSSDADCVEFPMAVLVNGDSYSAAEFFAAALQEYDWAVVVGQQTCGKGYFQSIFPLADGSAVGISIGKYFTPEGKSLIGTGILPDVPVDVDTETYSEIYYGTLDHEEDPQIQAAISALNSAQ